MTWQPKDTVSHRQCNASAEYELACSSPHERTEASNGGLTVRTFQACRRIFESVLPWTKLHVHYYSRSLDAESVVGVQLSRTQKSNGMHANQLDQVPNDFGFTWGRHALSFTLPSIASGGHACCSANSFMNVASACAPSGGMALYTDARMPPTERWPFSSI